jgi:hypothetical protein
VTEDFEAVRLPIDVAEFHTYGVNWATDRADFLDGEPVRSCPRPPSYPLQMMLAVFDFPTNPPATTPTPYPRWSWTTCGGTSADRR